MSIDTGREQAHAERRVPTLAAEIDHLRELLQAYRDGGPAPEPPPPADGPPQAAIHGLARTLGLSSFERQVLLLAAAVELDGHVASLVASVHGTSDPCPTFGLALALLPDAHWDAIASCSPLRRWRLLELGGGPTLASRPLRIDERILLHLTGLPAADDRLRGAVREGSETVPLAPSQHQIVAELARVLFAAAVAVIRLDGDDVDARLGVAQGLAGELGLVPLLVSGAALARPGHELAGQALLLDRETLLLGGLPIVDADGCAEEVVAGLLDHLRAPVVVVLGAYAGRSGGRMSLPRLIRLPSPAERRDLWAGAFGERATSGLAATIDAVAQHHGIGAAAVDAIARELAATRCSEHELARELHRLCRERSRAGLDGLAERIDSVATWDDLVLPDGHLELLRDIARHVRHRSQVYERWGFGERTTRGLGVTALFAGESGTGKTLAAEVLARDLGLDMYRIDLSATVSKYIGETEKNLSRLFDAAEASGAVLLFDEADALFGKRGDVKDGHDRYANLEVAYLLQRMDSYRGLAILTTNLLGHVDHAFLRRLRFVVQFPFPSHAQRRDMWRRAFPAATPLDGIDPERLASLAIPGGSIRSIALASAFAAAQDGTPVTRAHVLRATQLEYAKFQRTPPGDDGTWRS